MSVTHAQPVGSLGQLRVWAQPPKPPAAHLRRQGVATKVGLQSLVPSQTTHSPGNVGAAHSPGRLSPCLPPIHCQACGQVSDPK